MVAALAAQSVTERTLEVVGLATCRLTVCIGATTGSMSARPDDAARSHARSERSAPQAPTRGL